MGLEQTADRNVLGHRCSHGCRQGRQTLCRCRLAMDASVSVTELHTPVPDHGQSSRLHQALYPLATMSERPQPQGRLAPVERAAIPIIWRHSGASKLQFGLLELNLALRVGLQPNGQRVFRILSGALAAGRLATRRRAPRTTAPACDCSTARVRRCVRGCPHGGGDRSDEARTRWPGSTEPDRRFGSETALVGGLSPA
jgi:hypothetical protein